MEPAVVERNGDCWFVFIQIARLPDSCQ